MNLRGQSAAMGSQPESGAKVMSRSMNLADGEATTRPTSDGPPTSESRTSNCRRGRKKHGQTLCSWLLVLGIVGGSGTVAIADDILETAAEPFTEPAEVFSDEADDEIETDRDSFTPATSVVGRRVVVESSYSFLDSRGGHETHSFPELLTRIGIHERIELRLGGNYEVGGGGSVSGAGSPFDEEPLIDELSHEANLLYGFKVALTGQDRWRPRSALIVQASTPTTGEETATQFNLGYVFGWKLPNAWVFDTALRYGADSELGDHFNQWAPSVVLKVPVHEQWNAHLEYFGIWSDQKEADESTQYVSPGLHYLITPDLEIGVRVGWGLNSTSAAFFSNVGAGLRF